MRFLFENGGRSGIRDVEALAHALEAYNNEGRATFGRLLVDYSESKSGPGVEFRAVRVLLADMSAAMDAAIKAKKGTGMPPDLATMWAAMAMRYWTEAEAAELGQVTSNPLSRRAKEKGL